MEEHASADEKGEPPVGEGDHRQVQVVEEVIFAEDRIQNAQLEFVVVEVVVVPENHSRNVSLHHDYKA